MFPKPSPSPPSRLWLSTCQRARWQPDAVYGVGGIEGALRRACKGYVSGANPIITSAHEWATQSCREKRRRSPLVGRISPAGMTDFGASRPFGSRRKYHALSMPSTPVVQNGKRQNSKPAVISSRRRRCRSRAAGSHWGPPIRQRRNDAHPDQSRAGRPAKCHHCDAAQRCPPA